MSDEKKALEFYKTAAVQTPGSCPRPKYIPKRILLSRTVRGVCLPGSPRIIAKPGEYEAHVNPNGAVSVKTKKGLLGVMLDEFEVVEWQENPHAEEE
jgi:hypothetical protein